MYTCTYKFNTKDKDVNQKYNMICKRVQVEVQACIIQFPTWWVIATSKQKERKVHLIIGWDGHPGEAKAAQNQTSRTKMNTEKPQNEMVT